MIRIGYVDLGFTTMGWTAVGNLVVEMEVPQTIDGLATAGIDHVVLKDVARKGVVDVTDKGTASGLTDVGDVSSTTREFIVIPQNYTQG